ncbi:MAG: hypothetical protein K6U74_05680 [Firmicutes bacterium]|nr:hypothetical protein [Bacillota bacterium]
MALNPDGAQGRTALVKSLASAIQEKLVDPAACRIESIDARLQELGEKVQSLEKELALLTLSHSKTRKLAGLTLAGLVILAAVLIIPFIN